MADQDIRSRVSLEQENIAAVHFIGVVLKIFGSRVIDQIGAVGTERRVEWIGAWVFSTGTGGVYSVRDECNDACRPLKNEKIVVSGAACAIHKVCCFARISNICTVGAYYRRV